MIDRFSNIKHFLISYYENRSMDLNFCNQVVKFSEEESAQLTQVFKNGSFSSDVARPTRFKMLEKFIFTYRNSGVSPDDPLLPYWLLHVAPSCVYPILVDGRPSFYRCCFKDCERPVNSQFALIRHYKEQHYHQIPQGIFGEITYFPCTPCKVIYKRLDHLKSHQASQTHKAIMARHGDIGSEKDVSVMRQAKSQNEEARFLARQAEFKNEAEAWYNSTLPPCQAPTVTTPELSLTDLNDDSDVDDDQMLIQAAHLFETLNK